MAVAYPSLVPLSTTLNLRPPMVSTTDLPSGKYWMSLISSMVPKSENLKHLLYHLNYFLVLKTHGLSLSFVHIPNSLVPANITLLIIKRYLGSNTCRGQGMFGKLIVQTNTENLRLFLHSFSLSRKLIMIIKAKPVQGFN